MTHALSTLAFVLAASVPTPAPLVLEGRALHVKDPQIEARIVDGASVLASDGKKLVLGREAVKQEEGGIVVLVPERVDSGTLVLFIHGAARAFSFATKEASSRRASAPWDAATRAACLAIAGVWTGRLSGNDPDVRAGLSVEIDADCRTVHAILYWRSATSGQNDRVLAGTWDPKLRTFVAADVNLNGVAPMGGWRFCLIDRYNLSLSEDGMQLTGRYFSKGCSDDAKVELRRPESPSPR